MDEEGKRIDKRDTRKTRKPMVYDYNHKLAANIRKAKKKAKREERRKK